MGFLDDSDYTSGISWGGIGHTADEDLSLSRTRQTQALQRQAPQIDYTGANGSLGQAAALQQRDAGLGQQQQGALAALRAQSAGQTASAANINAGLGSQAAAQSALQGLAGGHSTLANAAMTRQAMNAGAQAQLANSGSAAMARQQEYANANGLLGSYAGDVRQADYANALAAAKAGSMQGAMSNAQAQQNLAQQNLNQQYAENQMQQRYGINQSLISGEEDALNRYYSDKNQYYQNNLTDQQNFQAAMGAGTQAVGSLGAAAATSFGSGGGGGYTSTMGGNASTAGSSINNSASSFNQAYAMPSDARTKQAAGDWGVWPLYAPEGTSLAQTVNDDGTGHAYTTQLDGGQGGGLPTPSLASSPRAQSEPVVVAVQAAPAKRAERKMTDKEMLALADQYIAETNADSARRQAAPNAIDQGVLADANRKMAGQPYTYKPEFTPPDEVPGQVHHGFMAQNLEQNPVTATAVETGPDGVKKVHGHRMLQAMASGISDLQRQVDQMRGGQ